MSKKDSVKHIVIDAEHKLEKDDQGINAAKKESMKFPMIFLGALVYSVGLNYFLRQVGLYSGGFMGFAQLFEFLLRKVGLNFGNFNLSGILYWLMNVPAIIIAFKKMRKRFIIKTLFAITSVTLLLTVIPIPKTPILEDTLANTIIAGFICGAGTGIILWMGGCDGGMNIVSMIYISTKGKGSIGVASTTLNSILYLIMLFLFDVPTVIYSLIYSVFSSIATDKIHTQNINSEVMIITKLSQTKDMEIEVMSRLHRGMTEIDGNGLFTGEEVRVLIVYISKFEYSRLRGIIRAHDPNAFIVETTGVRIDGKFNKYLT
ncbi:MAG: YitT family protein [Lachnospiraceae bacterium]|nr:YitT family protein [Lachnospiraceae bacterium]